MRTYLPVGVGGMVEWYAPLRPDAGPTVEVRAGDGSALVAALTAASPGLDSVNTTLTAGAAKGERELTVTSGTSIVAKRRYLVGGVESVQVKAVSGVNVTLMRPLMQSHANGVAFAGTLIQHTITAGVAATQHDDCWAIFTWSNAASVPTARPPGRVDFTISRGYVTNPFTADELRVTDPAIVERCSEDTDFDALCTLAFEEVLERLRAGGMPVQDLVAGSHRIKPVVRYLTHYLCQEQAGSTFDERERVRSWTRFENLLSVFGSGAPVDDDRDSAIIPQEKWTAPSITLRRS